MKHKPGRARPSGVTLVEVVLATGVAAVFLTAFMVQYRVQQSSFQVASDELRLPPAGFNTTVRMLGVEGFLACYQPAPTSPDPIEVRPDRVTLPIGGRNTTTRRQLGFVETPNDPRPAGKRPNRVVARDFASLTLTREMDLSSPTLIASGSFYSPDLLVNPTWTLGIIDSTAYAAPGTVFVGSSPAFSLLGAAHRIGETGGKALLVNHAAGTSTWTFQIAGGAPKSVEFRAGEAFFIDFGSQLGGVLACAWPLAPIASSVTGVLTYTVRDAENARRIGFWLQLNTGPYTGKIALRDSAFLRY